MQIPGWGARHRIALIQARLVDQEELCLQGDNWSEVQCCELFRNMGEGGARFHGVGRPIPLFHANKHLRPWLIGPRDWHQGSWNRSDPHIWVTVADAKTSRIAGLPRHVKRVDSTRHLRTMRAQFLQIGGGIAFAPDMAGEIEKQQVNESQVGQGGAKRRTFLQQRFCFPSVLRQSAHRQTSRLLFNLCQTLHLDRYAKRKRDAADGGAGMPPYITEHFDHQVRCAVDDLWLVGKIWH